MAARRHCELDTEAVSVALLELEREIKHEDEIHSFYDKSIHELSPMEM